MKGWLKVLKNWLFNRHLKMRGVHRSRSTFRGQGVTIDSISDKLIQYLNTPTPSYAVLLRGDWGVGKSFYWQEFKKKYLPKGSHDITFSVAGLATLEEIERSLFLASIEDMGPGILQETGAVVGRALLRWVKVEPSDIKLKADVRPNRTVICIDDIERFGGDFKVLLGFIVSVLDDANLHVVLIADEKRALTLNGYPECKERIIARSYDVQPALESFFSSTVNEYRIERVRACLLEKKSEMISLFLEKELRNLRTVRAVLDEVNTLLSRMEWPNNRSISLNALLSAITFHTIAVSRNPASAPLVAHIFEQGDLGIALAFRQSFNETQGADGESSDSQQSGDLMQSLGFDTEAYGWPASASFAAYVRGQPYDADALANDFGLFGEPDRQGQTLLEQFRSYRSMSEDDFEKAIVELHALLSNRHFERLQDILTAHEILDHLSRERLIPEDADWCRETILDIISRCDPAGGIGAELHIWPEKSDANRDAVIKALEELEVRVRAKEEEAGNRRLQLAIIEGEDESEWEATAVPFVDAEPAEIYERLIRAGRPAIHRMSKFYARRLSVSNIAEYTEKEAPFAVQLARVIDADLPEEGVFTLEQAALCGLARGLKRFVLTVTEGQSTRTKNTDLP
ncbi:P-loop NTPase fold protein [Alkalisalibacterium limincola]|uniref:KAP NTPase domain-containing protein n=1 Tax=Alkalisalibacterium limincola TaxID=2699169 RepID=A0A5C8KXI1_9GAMM|nr:P-loop NTPase fold protein [Alkalisalibacterium limincola]TXK65108.1 hypothetical protein FU658_04860 [Alkalisalibacterium limincola]